MNDHLRDWFAKTPMEERERVASSAQTTVGHLRQLAGGHRKASPELAERLQEASSGKLTIGGLRPDLVALAHKILSSSCAPSNSDGLPTLNANLRKKSAIDQSADNAGVLSSVGGAQ